MLLGENGESSIEILKEKEWFIFFKRFYGEVYDQLREFHRPKFVEISFFYVKSK